MGLDLSAARLKLGVICIALANTRRGPSFRVDLCMYNALRITKTGLSERTELS